MEMPRCFLKIQIITVITCLLVGGISCAQVITHEHTLENGLKLIVREDHRAPIIISQIWYKIGSRHEHRGYTGISHILEHMMFQGSRNYPKQEFSRLTQEKGGNSNAFTTFDYTVYFQELPAKDLALNFQLEADRMMNLNLEPEAFAKEIKVVTEERLLRIDDNPEALIKERFYATAFSASPYQHPIIGWMNDIEHLKLTELENWYQNWYAPNNAVIVVVGSIKPELVFSLAKQHFGSIPSRKIKQKSPRRALPALGERKVEVKLPAQVEQLYIGYNVPSVSTADLEWEPYALDVLVEVLDGGSSRRLTKELIRQNKTASHVHSWYNPFNYHSTLLTVSATPAKHKTTYDLETAILKQISILQDELVSEQELERIKINILAQNIFEQDSMFQQAYTLGALETNNYGWKTIEEYIDKINMVTAQQIQTVAKKYLVQNRRTIARLVPLQQEQAPQGV
jgi:zinc protease